MTQRLFPRDRGTALGVCLLIALGGLVPGCGTDYVEDDTSGARSRPGGGERHAATETQPAPTVSASATEVTPVDEVTVIEPVVPEIPATIESADLVVVPAEDPHQAFREAEALYRQGDREAAISLLQSSILARDDFAPAHYLLGLCQWKTGDLAGAEAALTTVLEIEPRHLRARINLGRVLVENERGAEAVDVLRVAINDGVESDDLWNVQGLALMSQGELDAADAAFSRAIEIDPANVYPLNNLGLCRIRAGRFEDAVEPLLQAAEMDRAPAYVFNNLGLAMEQIGQLSEARDALAQATEMGHPTAPLSMARVDDQIEWMAATAPEPANADPATTPDPALVVEPDAATEEQAPADSLGASASPADEDEVAVVETSLAGSPRPRPRPPGPRPGRPRRTTVAT